jgi:hypothetical protein
MAIAFGTEVNKFLLPVCTGLHHSLLAGSIRSHDTVTFHFAFVSHYFFFAAFFITALTTFFATAFFTAGPTAAGDFSIEEAGKFGFAFFIVFDF